MVTRPVTFAGQKSGVAKLLAAVMLVTEQLVPLVPELVLPVVVVDELVAVVAVVAVVVPEVVVVVPAALVPVVPLVVLAVVPPGVPVPPEEAAAVVLVLLRTPLQPLARANAQTAVRIRFDIQTPCDPDGVVMNSLRKIRTRTV
jgi:hypothetical protein